MYKLEKARHSESSEEHYYVITFDDSVVYPLSRWAKMKNLAADSKPTSYMTTVVRFINFLHQRKVQYYNATAKDIMDFFTIIVEYDKDGEYCNTSQVQVSTINLYEAALVNFYKHLTDFYDNNIIKTIDTTFEGKAVELVNVLKTRWMDVKVEAKRCINFTMNTHLANDKVYIKEYTDEQLSALYRSFKKPIYKAIFVLSLKGLRIDEVLSIKMEDYDPKAMTVQPSRSKGLKKKKSNIRTIFIGPEVVQVIESYLFHDRNPAYEIVKQEKRNSEYLFVTTRKSDERIPFTPYTQSSFRSALIRTATRAGIKGNVRTHAGRSHRSIELTRLQHQGVITDEQLRLIMGWKSMEAHRPYDEHVHKEEAERILEKVSKKRISRLDALLRAENEKGTSDE